MKLEPKGRCSVLVYSLINILSVCLNGIKKCENVMWFKRLCYFMESPLDANKTTASQFYALMFVWI